MGAVLPFISLGATAFGAVSSVIGAVAGQRSAQAQATYQSQVARNNAEIARHNAYLAEQEGEAQATAQGLKGSQEMGALRAGQAASGVDLNTGSSAQVQADQARLNQLDTMTIKSRAARAAYGYEVQRQQARDEQRLARASRPTFWQSFLSIGGAAAKGIGAVADQASSMSNAGAFNFSNALPTDALASAGAGIGAGASGGMEAGMIGTIPGIF